MPEWGVTGTVYLQQITSYAFTAQSNYSVSSHKQNFASPLLARPPPHTAHCRTRFVQLVPLFISRPDSRRGGSRDCRNSLDFSLDNRDIAARFPRRTNKFTVFQNAQTGSGADPLSYLQGTRGFSPGVNRL
jgi:hypothetical protein